MIPKIIHYCWFGHNPKPKLSSKCIKSWRKKCPNYQIIEWNEDNFSIASCPLYVQQAFELEKWAFVTDYVRLKVVYEHGGIYLDTDVELIKNIDHLLDNNAYFGFEDGVHIATGLGFGAERRSSILKELMDDYNDIPFILDNGECDYTPCPVRNTKVFLKHGLIQNNQLQYLDDKTTIFPSDYLCPLSYEDLKKHITKNTVSIHWFNASWRTEQEKKIHKKRIKEEQIDKLIHIPNRIVRRLIGETLYRRIKKAFFSFKKKGN